MKNFKILQFISIIALLIIIGQVIFLYFINNKIDKLKIPEVLGETVLKAENFKIVLYKIKDDVYFQAFPEDKSIIEKIKALNVENSFSFLVANQKKDSFTKINANFLKDKWQSKISYSELPDIFYLNFFSPKIITDINFSEFKLFKKQDINEFQKRLVKDIKEKEKEEKSEPKEKSIKNLKNEKLNKTTKKPKLESKSNLLEDFKNLPKKSESKTSIINIEQIKKIKDSLKELKYKTKEKSMPIKILSPYNGYIITPDKDLIVNLTIANALRKELREINVYLELLNDKGKSIIKFVHFAYPKDKNGNLWGTEWPRDELLEGEYLLYAELVSIKDIIYSSNKIKLEVSNTFKESNLQEENIVYQPLKRINDFKDYFPEIEFLSRLIEKNNNFLNQLVSKTIKNKIELPIKKNKKIAGISINKVLEKILNKPLLIKLTEKKVELKNINLNDNEEEKVLEFLRKSSINLENFKIIIFKIKENLYGLSFDEDLNGLPDDIEAILSKHIKLPSILTKALKTGEFKGIENFIETKNFNKINVSTKTINSFSTKTSESYIEITFKTIPQKWYMLLIYSKVPLISFSRSDTLGNVKFILPKKLNTGIHKFLIYNLNDATKSHKISLIVTNNEIKIEPSNQIIKSNNLVNIDLVSFEYISAISILVMLLILSIKLYKKHVKKIS